MVNSWSLLYDEMYGPEDEAANLKEWKENLEAIDADFQEG